MNIKLRMMGLCMVAFLVNTANSAKPEIDAVDWPDFMAKQDMRWNQPPISSSHDALDHLTQKANS